MTDIIGSLLTSVLVSSVPLNSSDNLWPLKPQQEDEGMLTILKITFQQESEKKHTYWLCLGGIDSANPCALQKTPSCRVF